MDPNSAHSHTAVCRYTTTPHDSTNSASVFSGTVWIAAISDPAETKQDSSLRILRVIPGQKPANPQLRTSAVPSHYVRNKGMPVLERFLILMGSDTNGTKQTQLN